MMTLNEINLIEKIASKRKSESPMVFMFLILISYWEKTRKCTT